MRTRHKVVLILAVTGSLVVGLPVGATTAIYIRTLRDLGELPRPSAGPLPRLVELGVWQATGENAAAFHVETTWPWTPVLDLAHAFASGDGRPVRRPGNQAAYRLSGLWLATKTRTGIGEWHLRRAAMTVWLTRHWSAAELTQEIAQRSSFGRKLKGIEPASRAFFGKTSEQLEIAEAALLVAILESRIQHGPNRDPERALKRRNRVLRAWQEAGLLTAEQARSESAKPIGILPLE